MVRAALTVANIIHHEPDVLYTSIWMKNIWSQKLLAANQFMTEQDVLWNTNAPVWGKF
jgi:hypothetical protein